PVCTSAFPRSTRTAVARGSGPLAGASVDAGVRLLQAGQQRVQVLAAPVAQLLAEFSRRVLRCMGRVVVELLVQGALEAQELLDASQLLFGHPGHGLTSSAGDKIPSGRGEHVGGCRTSPRQR